MTYEEFREVFSADEPVPTAVLIHLHPVLHQADNSGGCADATVARQAVDALGQLLQLLSRLAAPVASQEVSVSWSTQGRCRILEDAVFQLYTSSPDRIRGVKDGAAQLAPSPRDQDTGPRPHHSPTNLALRD